MTSPHEVATILAIPERRAGTPWHQLLHVEETSEFGPEKVQRLIEMAERDYLVAAGLIATEALHSEINAVLAAAQKWAAAATGKDPEEKQSAKAEWYQAGEELKAEKRPSGKQASVRGRLRDLLEPAGMTLSQANGAPAWVDVFLNDDMGMDFQHLGACLRLLFRNLTEHSENPSNCSVRGYLVADEQLVSIDLLLCLEDPRGPNEPMRAAEIFGGNGTVTRAAKDLEGAARFVVVQEAPQGRSDPGDPALPQKAEPIPWPGMPKPNRADLRHVHGASADGCFAFILEFPLPMSDKVLDSILQTSRRGPPLPMVWEVLIEADDVSGQGVSL